MKTLQQLEEWGQLSTFASSGLKGVEALELPFYTSDHADTTGRYVARRQQVTPIIFNFNVNHPQKQEFRGYIKRYLVTTFWEVPEFATRLKQGLQSLRQTLRADACDIFDYDEFFAQPVAIALVNYMEEQPEEIKDLLEYTFIETIQRVNAYIMDNPKMYRGANLFSTLYNQILLLEIYSQFNLKEKKFPKKLVDGLSLIRSCTVFLDNQLAHALMAFTRGCWASVRFEDVGVPMPPQNFTFIDLFAGIGSFRKSFEAAGGKAVWTNDYDRYSATMYAENFSVEDEEILVGRIQHRPKLPKADVILAGFPCKSFSKMGTTSGNRRFLEHPEYGKLIFEVLDIIEELKPKAYVLENVDDFLKVLNDPELKEDLYDQFLQRGSGAKYRMEYTVKYSSGYVGQMRKRLFIVGIREDVYPQYFDLDQIPFASEEYKPQFQSQEMHIRQEKAEPPYTLPWLEGQSIVNPHFNMTEKSITRFSKKLGLRGYPTGNNFGFRLYPADGLNQVHTLLGGVGGTFGVCYTPIESDEEVWRFLTPRECTRLMGFDPDRTARIKINVSNTQAYRACGYSIVTPHATEIALYVAHILNSK